MKLFVLLFSIFLQKRISIPGYHRNNRWYYGLLSRLESMGLKGDSRLVFRYVLAVIVPTIILGLFDWWLKPFAFGLPVVALEIFLMLYILGRADVKGHMGEYIKCWHRQDYEAAYLCAHDFLRVSDLEKAPDPVTLHGQFLNALLYRWFERFFVVIFGYMTLGIAGAVFCFLTILFTRRYCKNKMAQRLLYFMEWLPSRCLGFSFVLAGNYVAGIKAWLRGLWDFKLSTQDYLLSTGLESLELQECHQRLQELSAESLAKTTEQEVHEVQNMLFRCAVIWLVIFALMSLMGWA